MKSFKTSLVILLLFRLAPSHLLAQSVNINEELEYINDNIEEVQTEDEVYRQSLELVNNDAKAKASIVKIDKKGKSKQTTYIFNFRDISKQGFNYKIEKDIITIKIATSSKEKFIKEEREGSTSRYVSDFEFYLRDYEQAKAIIEKLKQVQESLAQIPPQNYPPDNYNELRQWLKQNVVGHQKDRETVEQSISLLPNNELVVGLTRHKNTSKNQSTSYYEFNLADLLSSAIEISINGGEFNLKLPINGKNKFISFSENGEIKNNISEVVLSHDDLDKIKLWSTAFEKITSISQEILKNQEPEFSDYLTAVNYLKKSQQIDFKEECLCSLKYSEGDAEDVEISYFNFADLNAFTSPLGVSKSSYVLSLETKEGVDYVAKMTGPVLEKFVDEVVLSSSNLEDVRYIEQASKAIIKYCQENYRLPTVEGGKSEFATALGKLIPNFRNESSSLSQKFSYTNDPCDLTFTRTEEGKKTIVKEYDFKAYFFDARLCTVQVSTRNAYVNLITKDKEKIINVTENGKPDDFENEIQIQVDEILLAKQIKETFQKLINTCK